MKKLQVARFLFTTTFIAWILTLNAAITEYAPDYPLPGDGELAFQNRYYTGIVSDDGPARQSGTEAIYLANPNNDFSGGIRIRGGSTCILGLGYPPAGLTTTITNSGNSYMGTNRRIIFLNDGGILELGCDMSNANITFRSNSASGATIRGFNETSIYEIRLSSHQSGQNVQGSITVGAGATVILDFPLPVGDVGTQYSAFNISGTATNSGTLRLFNGASSSTAAINVNAYGVLDCSLCTTALATALSAGTLTVAANGKIIFPSTSGTWAKAIG